MSDIDELKSSLTDIRNIIQLLELDEGATKQQGGMIIRCPWHAENKPSCSITIGREGTLRANCFGCDKTGDVFDLIAVARDLDIGHDFRQILDIAAAMAGYTLQENREPPKRFSELHYPDAHHIVSSWKYFTSNPLNNKDTRAWLVRRKIDYLYSQIDLMCRAISPIEQVDSLNCPLLFKRWRQSGHKLIFPLYDYKGKMRSFSGRYVGTFDGAVKSKFPKGYKKEGLCLMNPTAIDSFRYECNRMHTLIITEGEPDFLTVAMTDRYPVIGIVGHGSINSDYQKKLNTLRKVVICTDADKAGDLYAENIRSLLNPDVKCLRLDVNDLIK